MTKIFLSWSGDAGRDIANALRDLLPVPLPMSDPFMSDIDIKKGRRWREELDNQLRETDWAMFIITRENIEKPSDWMAYEAGAVISKKGQDIRILTLLFDVQQVSIPKYLIEFQLSIFKEEEWKKLLGDLRDDMRKNPEKHGISIENLGNIDTLFRLFWRDFEERVRKILNKVESAHQDTPNSDLSNQGYTDSQFENISKSIEALSSFVFKIPGIETKIDDFFSQFESFQSQIALPLRDMGMITSQDTSLSGGNREWNRYPSSAMSRLRNTVAFIDEKGLLDENTLQELKSALADLG